MLKVCTAEKVLDYPLEEAGVWVDCVRTRRAVFHNDYQDLPDRKGLPDGHVPLERHLSVPILDKGKIVAIIGVGNKTEPYDECDARQLSLFIGLMWELIRRMRAEEVLRRSEADYRSLVEHATYGIYRSSVDDRFLAVNLALVDMLGYESEEELLSVKPSDLYQTPEDRERMIERHRGARRIKDDAELRDTVLILLASNPTHPEEHELAEAGFSGCVTTPVRPSRLMDALVNAMFPEASAEGVGLGGPRPDLSPGPRLHVLLAEDNLINQELGVLQLEQLNCHVDVAANGIEAATMAGLFPYDLILMDCEMPEMDGFDATRRIRSAQKAGSRVPIIAVTAHAMSGYRDRCLAAGMDDYLAKPIRVEDLAAVLRRHLPAAGPTPPAAGPHPPPGGRAVDAERLLSQIGVARGLRPEFARLFAKSTEDNLARVRDALACGDGETLRRAAHTLHGALKQVCATNAADLAARLEQAAVAGTLDAAAALLVQLEDATAAAVREVHELVETSNRLD